MSAREDLTFPSGEETCAAWLYRPERSAGPAPLRGDGPRLRRHPRGPPARLRRALRRRRPRGAALRLPPLRRLRRQPRQLLDIGRQQADYRAAVAFARTLGGHRPAAHRALRARRSRGGHVVAAAAQDPASPPSCRSARSPTASPRCAAAAARRAARHRARPRRPGRARGPGAPRARCRPRARPGRSPVMTAPDARRARGDRPAGLAVAQRGGRAGHAARRALPARAPGAVGRLPAAGVRVRARQTTPPAAAVKMGERAPRGEVLRYPSGTSRSTSASSSSAPSPTRRRSSSATWRGWRPPRPSPERIRLAGIPDWPS